jgi:hypothetical protein
MTSANVVSDDLPSVADEISAEVENTRTRAHLEKQPRRASPVGKLVLRKGQFLQFLQG